MKLKRISMIASCSFLAVSVMATPAMKRHSIEERADVSGAMPQLRMATTVETPLPEEPLGRLALPEKQNDGLFRPQTPPDPKRQKAMQSVANAFRRILDNNIDVRGQMTYHDAWDETNWMKFQGFYSLPHSSSDNFILRGLTSNGINWGGYYDPENHVYHGICSDLSLSAGGGTYCYNIAYNTDTWQRVQGDVLGTFMMAAFSVARDPVDGKVYGYYINDFGNGMIWAEGDYSTSTRRKIADVDYTERMILMAADESGQFYGINIKGELCKVDKTNGSHTVIGPTTMPILYRAGCVINNRNHTMLATSFHLDFENSGLWEIDLKTGATTQVAKFFGDIQVMNLFIDSSVSEKAPAKPELSVEAPEGSATATYTLTMPATLFDGTEINGAIDWKVLHEGTEIASGRNQAGSTVSGNYTVDKEGKTTFTAYCYNEAGESPRSNVSIFIGKGIPKAPTKVTLAYEEGKLKLTWNNVTESVDGGYVNPEEVTYTVKSIDGTKYENIKGNSWELQIEPPVFRTIYQYSVTASYAGKNSDETVGNFIALGAYDTPYDFELINQQFNVARTHYGYTDYNGDNDNNRWGFGAGGASYKIQYATTQQADDWMITPEIHLEEGKVYEFTAPAYTQSATSVSKPQILSVYVGQGVTSEQLTTCIVEETEVCAYKDNPALLRGTFKAPATGNYNFAVRCTTPRKSQYSYGSNTVYVAEVHVTDGMNELAPALVTNVTVTPDATGLHKAAISLNAPTTTIMGDPLTGRVTLDIYRDSTKIRTVTVNAGAKTSYTDTGVEERGDYTYSIVATQNGNSGPAYKKKVYVGPYAAKAPENVQILEAYQPGYVMVYWDPVTTDINKNPISASNVTYMVYALRTIDGENTFVPMLDAPVKTASAVFCANENPAEQRLVEYFVKASNREAEGSWARSPFIAVGNAYKLPVKYSDLSDINSHVLGTGSLLSGAGFSFVGNGDGVTAQDGDDCFFASSADVLDKSCFLFTGKIDLADCVRPELSFYTWRLDMEDINRIQTHILADGKWTTVTPSPDFGYASLSEMTPGQWTKVRYDLSQFKGKHIQVRFTSYHRSHLNTLIDNIRIQEVADKDLVALSIEAPGKVKAEDEFDVKVNLTSFGYLTASDYTVNLYRDGELVDSQKASGLEYQQNDTIVFRKVISLFDENNTSATYSAEIVYEGDKDESNNVTAETLVLREPSLLPAVTDLTGEMTDEGIKLNWTPYTYDALEPTPFTETFEDAESWGTEVNGWTMVDEDKEPIITNMSGGIKLPFQSRSKLPWFVFDDTEFQSKTAALAHEGHKYLGSSSSVDCDSDEGYEPPSKDWAMSPALCGSAQTISFWAKSLTSGERIQVWYATEYTDDIKKFTQIKGDFGGSTGNQTVPGTWTQYSVDLPEGALRFAIRSYSVDRWMLMVDDVTFTPDPNFNVPVLVGYNVYRNGTLINEQPVMTGEYFDANKEFGKHTYHVKALFDKGPSELSNPAEFERPDLSSVDLTSDNKVMVKVKANDIIISGAELNPVMIATADGKVVYRGVGDTVRSVSSGVYIVTIGKRAFKVMVN